MKLKRKHQRLIGALKNRIKEKNPEFMNKLTDTINGKVINVSDSDIVKFQEDLSGETLEQFKEMADVQKRAVVSKKITNDEMMSFFMSLLDNIVDEDDLIVEALDEVISAATEKSIDELQDMEIEEYYKLVVEVAKVNINFFGSSLKAK